MYQEVREVYFTSGIIKVMKIESRNKWKKKKTDSVKLNTSIYWDLMKDSRHKLDTSRSMKLCDFKILRFEFRLMMTWMIRVSLSTTLDHIKGLF